MPSGDPGDAARFEDSEAYAELKAIAEREFRRERSDHTLQATALVNEVWLQMAGRGQASQSRSQFLGFAAQAMRHLLIDHARRRQSLKRGGELQRVILVSGDGREPAEIPTDLLDLDAALERLGRAHPRQARVVELKFFGGASLAEIAEALGVSHMTVSTDWRQARVWLARELSG
jgi:RNA polymerase sigma factor (TIGR02999 family)